VSYALRCPTLVYEVIPDHFDPSGEAPLVAIRKRLDHLRRLRVDGLALTPIFPADDPLRRHTRDYRSVDPALGTEDDFRALCVEAGHYGISVTLMGVFDHVSVEHPWFVAAAQQTDDDRRVPLEQRTRSFFHFGAGHRHGYACREADPAQPELELKHPELRKRLFTGEDSVMHHWMHAGASGWRILGAERIGHSILRELARGARTVEGSHFVVGDIRGFADRSLRDGLLDAVVNHYAREAVLAYLRGEVPARQLARVIRELARAYDRALLRSWNLISAHDTPRIRALVHDDERARIGTLLSYTLPGAAHVLYGEEVGLRSTTASAPMTWDEAKWNGSLLEFHETLGTLRAQRTALTTGDFVDLTPEGEEDVFAFARVTLDPRQTVIVVVNRAERVRTRKLFAPVSELPDGLKLKDALGGPGALVQSGTITLELAPRGARVLAPDDADEASAHFFDRDGATSPSKISPP
jgi:alpha-glucosidase